MVPRIPGLSAKKVFLAFSLHRSGMAIVLGPAVPGSRVEKSREFRILSNQHFMNHPG
jgi:hypothetical protein